MEEFWLDAVEGYTKVQYIGRVAIALTVSDGRTGATLATRRYVGIKRQEGDARAEPPSREIMNAALVRVMHDVATDRELVSALARAPEPSSPSAGWRPGDVVTTDRSVS